MDNPNHFLPGLMMAMGGALQWLRSLRVFREEYYHAVAVFLGIVAYWMTMPYNSEEWRLWWLSCVEFLTIGGGLAMIWGGTFVMSNAAKGVVALGADAQNPVVPLTNSKG